MHPHLPFSQACENNKSFILDALKNAFSTRSRVLEIGSGTGQHAVHFAANLPHLIWQASERDESLATLQPWLDTYQGTNLLPAMSLDISEESQLANHKFDAAFSANTAHIMPWSITQRMIETVAKALPRGGVFVLYGPFNYQGQFTSKSNAMFDAHLRAVASHQGIRDFEKINSVAEAAGLNLRDDHTMPANNRLLEWHKA